MDRLIAKYSSISPAKALMMQAIGTERIESLCNTFCRDVAANRMITSRVSPGYGDIPMEMQRDIFVLLDCSKRIGITLSESLLMSPTKSVTAIFGVKNGNT
jgi:cobalamin-dependent methionine synthase I